MTELIDLEDAKAPPQPWVHAQTIYAAMKRDAVEQVTDERELMFVWEGYTTELFRDLEMPAPYYTSLLNVLKTMGSLRQIRRGGGAAKSQWEVLAEPTLDAFNDATAKLKVKLPGARVTKYDQQRKMISDLEGRVSTLEETVRALILAATGASDG